ncbi:24481_t:CDS:2 [Gigaspora margarita]|uniref:24481_t:CDS:1 n=1 Tax=Gigaspora margarita TaxID=4874 RepID=A0ABN7X1S4_GIGMA|nr:24481_t:CDS:2 [Gigaspora margarita]
MSLPNNINEESTLTISPEGDSSNSQQKITGQPFNPIWKHFNQVEKKGEHYLAKAQLFYFKQLPKDDEDQKLNKKQKVDIKNKKDILKYVENQELTPKGKNN